ncbi:CLAVATA3/ESR (CLE)-related protein [Melia azedarach]|uniref:CLAVATA3/ESR (CLE)-related protein n=1 Tax=Melia azedarach TaxID=155640 RepID=A0ACC1YSG9_MELAZ|nr:CLAVATA3/ESR (CLE)-related protein [Melia azedarach]
MASLGFCLCFSLILLSFSKSESRFLEKMLSADDRHKSLSDQSTTSVTEVSKTSIRKQEMIDRHFDSKQLSNDDESRALMESARNMFKQSVQRQEIIGKFSESKRVSPGGPDPHHH